MVQETHDAPVGRAIGLLLFGVMAGLGLDLCAKAILETYTLQQFVFLRSLIGLAIFLTLSYQFGDLAGLMTRRWGWHLLRTLLATGAMFGFFYGLARMPLIDALTLGFTAPLMMTALSVPMLGDRVGWRRWTAVIAGFLGVLMILRPGSGAVTFASLAVLFAAFCYACLAITARRLASTESTYSLSVYVVAGPMIISGLMSISGTGWRMPDLTGWVLFLLAGSCSVLAWIGLVGAYRQAPPSILAPFEYTALIAGAIAGYLIWDEVPDRWVVAGALVIIASGLFVVYRELGGAKSMRYLRAVTASGSALLSRRLSRPGAKRSR
jgi:drug/metabolite transporter (DMT)-like permease